MPHHHDHDHDEHEHGEHEHGHGEHGHSEHGHGAHEHEHGEHEHGEHEQGEHEHGAHTRGGEPHHAKNSGHGHDHSHHHHHAVPTDFRTAFMVGISLNLTYVVVETIYGVLSHSMSLVADAAHNLGDVLGLSLAWGATLLAKRKPSKRRTYGLRSSTILASLVNALVLLVVTGGILWESLRRLFSPEAVQGLHVIVVALVGVAINAFSALLFRRGRKDDLNLRGAFLHLAADAALAFGVAVAGALVLITGWMWLDPVVSMLLAIVILISTWSLLGQSTNLLLGAVPQGIDPDQIRTYLGSLPGVAEVHDLHIWAMSTTETALTAHLVLPGDSHHPELLTEVRAHLRQRFDIEHATLQLELRAAPDSCRLGARC